MTPRKVQVYLLEGFSRALLVSRVRGHWSTLQQGSHRSTVCEGATLFSVDAAFDRRQERLEALVDATSLDELQLWRMRGDAAASLLPVIRQIEHPGLIKLARSCEAAMDASQAEKCLESAVGIGYSPSARSYGQPMITIVVAYCAILLIGKHGFGAVGNTRLAYYVADAFRRCGLSRYSIAVLSSFIPSIASDPYYPGAFDLYCDALAYDQRSVDLCERDEQINGKSYWSEVNLGTAEYQRGKASRADSRYHAAAVLAGENVVVSPFNKGIFTWRPLSIFAALEKDVGGDDQAERWSIAALVQRELDCLHVVGADAAYFLGYGQRLVETSLARSGDRHGVHVHLVGADHECLQRLESLRSSSEGRLGYTVELLERGRHDAAYFASCRYMVLGKLMEIHQCPAFVTDIDMVVEAPWSATVEAMKEADLGFLIPDGVDLLRHETLRARPWALPAGYFYASTSSHSLQFVRLVARYLESFYIPSEAANYQAGGTRWVIDQVALRRSLDYFVEQSRPLVIKGLPKGYVRGPRKAYESKATFANTFDRSN